MVDVSVGVLTLSHFAAMFLGFGLGGLAAYKLTMRRMRSRVTSMFDFGNAGDLFNNIAEVEDE